MQKSQFVMFYYTYVTKKIWCLMSMFVHKALFWTSVVPVSYIEQIYVCRILVYLHPVATCVLKNQNPQKSNFNELEKQKNNVLYVCLGKCIYLTDFFITSYMIFLQFSLWWKSVCIKLEEAEGGWLVVMVLNIAI